MRPRKRQERAAWASNSEVLCAVTVAEGVELLMGDTVDVVLLDRRP
jgi:hypothetical protein